MLRDSPMIARPKSRARPTSKFQTYAPAPPRTRTRFLGFFVPSLVGSNPPAQSPLSPKETLAASYPHRKSSLLLSALFSPLSLSTMNPNNNDNNVDNKRTAMAPPPATAKMAEQPPMEKSLYGAYLEILWFWESLLADTARECLGRVTS